MTQPTITPAELEQDGIIYGIANMCVQALHEAAASATPERFIHLAARQVAEAGDCGAERVAAHLHTTLVALKASCDELRQADRAAHS